MDFVTSAANAICATAPFGMTSNSGNILSRASLVTCFHYNLNNWQMSANLPLLSLSPVQVELGI